MRRVFFLRIIMFKGKDIDEDVSFIVWVVFAGASVYSPSDGVTIKPPF